MHKCINKGYMLNISLDEYGYRNYSVDCVYRYDKQKEKYKLTMWLRHQHIDSMFKIESQKIDGQYISGTKDTIRENVNLIVNQAALSGFFDRDIESFEYTLKCFDRGNSLFEEEREVGNG